MRYLLFILFVVLLAGSVFFAQERIVFCDASFIFTEILNTGTLHIQEHRYGAFITQIVPLVAGKSHLSIGASLLAYSISFNLFYLIVASIIIFRFKNIPLATLMAFYFTLFVSDTYYWTNNEIHQAMTWMFLLWGMILRFKQRNYSFTVHAFAFAILAFLSLFTHPIAIIVFPFLWIFFMLRKEEWPYTTKETIFLSVLLLAICISKYLLMVNASYDAAKMRNATHFSIKDIIASLSSEMMKTMAIKLVTNYFFVPVLFIAGIISAIRTRQKKQLYLVISFALVYVIMLSLAFSTFLTFYIESEWMPLTIIATILFAYYTLPKIKAQTAVLLLSAIFLVRMTYIAQASGKFTERKEWVNKVLDNMKSKNITKGYIYADKNTDALLMMTWGLPTESLIASSLQGDRPVLTFVADSEERIKGRTSISNQDMVSCFSAWNNQHLNTNYFSIDTASAYKHIND